MAATDILVLNEAASMSDGMGGREDTDIGDDDMDVTITLKSFVAGSRGFVVSGRIPSGIVLLLAIPPEPITPHLILSTMAFSSFIKI